MSRQSSHAGNVVPSIEVRLSADRQTATITGGEDHDQMIALTLARESTDTDITTILSAERIEERVEKETANRRW